MEEPEGVAMAPAMETERGFWMQSVLPPEATSTLAAEFWAPVESLMVAVIEVPGSRLTHQVSWVSSVGVPPVRSARGVPEDSPPLRIVLICQPVAWDTGREPADLDGLRPWISRCSDTHT